MVGRPRNTLARRPTVSSRGRISTLPAPSTVRWNTLPGAPVHHAGGASAAALSKSNDHGSGSTTRTRAVPLAPATVAFTNPALDPCAAAVYTPLASTAPLT